jgi:hypothetical protein
MPSGSEMVMVSVVLIARVTCYYPNVTSLAEQADGSRRPGAKSLPHAGVETSLETVAEPKAMR